MSILLMVFSLALMFQAGEDASAPACNNHLKTDAAHRCSCGRAMTCEGHPDDAADESKGVKKCSKHCFPSQCRCISPCETRRAPRKEGAA